MIFKRVPERGLFRSEPLGQDMEGPRSKSSAFVHPFHTAGFRLKFYLKEVFLCFTYFLKKIFKGFESLFSGQSLLSKGTQINRILLADSLWFVMSGLRKESLRIISLQKEDRLRVKET